MTNEQQERHKRFEERFPLLGTLNGEPIENKIKSFLDEEISLAVANREKEIVEMIDSYAKSQSDEDIKLAIIGTLSIISKNK